MTEKNGTHLTAPDRYSLVYIASVSEKGLRLICAKSANGLIPVGKLIVVDSFQVCIFLEMDSVQEKWCSCCQE